MHRIAVDYAINSDPKLKEMWDNADKRAAERAATTTNGQES
jgi:hypothetical protein